MNNIPPYTKFRVLRHAIASAAEAELRALFPNGQTILGHQQPPTPIETDNYTALGIVNSTVKEKNPKQWT